MKNGLFKKSMSVFLSVLMLMTCWVFVPGEHNIEASAAVATGYGMTTVGTNTRTGTYRTNNKDTVDYIEIYYPAKMYIDITETLQDVGYSIGLSAHYGDANNYRTLIFPTCWGGQEIGEHQGNYVLKDYDFINNFDGYGITVSGGGFLDNYNVDGSANCVHVCENPTSNISANTKLLINGKPKSVGEYNYSLTGTNALVTAMQKNRPNNISVNNSYPVWHNSNNKTVGNIDMTIYVYDKSTLNSYINTYGNEKQALYTADSWSTYATALSQAKTILATREVTQSQVTTAQNNLSIAYNGLKKVLNVTYENLFSFSDWANSNCTNGEGSGSGTVSYNVTDGTISVNGSGDFYTAYGAGAGFYTVPVTAGKTYTLDYDVTGGSQVFVFFYSASGSGVTGIIKKDGTALTSPHLGDYSGKPITFTVPEGSSCTKIGFRFGINNSTSATFSNIALYDATRASEIGLESWDYRPYRYTFAQGVAFNTSDFAVPVRTGYTFGGWYLDEACANPVEPSYTLYESYATLYSKWSPTPYTITFDGNGYTGALPQNITYNIESTDVVIPSIERTGYNFGGWKVTTAEGNWTQDGIAVGTLPAGMYGNVTLTAQWKVAEPTVFFDTILDFSKWNTTTAGNGTISNVTGNGFTLTSNVGAGEATSTSPRFPVTAGEEYYIDIDVEGDNWDVYIFFYNATTNSGTGLGFSDANSRFSSTGHGDPYFTAPEGATEAVIRVDANGSENAVTFSDIRVYKSGTVIENVNVPDASKDVTYGTAYGTLPTPTRQGYTFAGWVDANGNAVTADTVVSATANHTLYSTWTVATQTIKLELAGGTGDTTCTYTTGEAFTLPTPTKEGYTFSGWQVTTADGNWQIGVATNDVPAGMYGEPTLTAQWDINSFTVTFVNAKGETVSTATYDYGTAASAVVKPANTAENYDENNHYTYSWPTINEVTGNATYNEVKTGTAHSYTYAQIANNKDSHTASCNCGYSKTVEHNFSKLEHNATCDIGAYTTYTCTDCSFSYNGETGEPLGHDYVVVSRDEPDCTTPGTAHFDCSRCDATKDEELAALGHTFTETDYKAPTCISAGNEAYKYCTTCQLYFAADAATNSTVGLNDTSSFVLNATGVHEYGDWSQFNNGSTHRRNCKNCTAYEEGAHDFTADMKPHATISECHDFACSACGIRGAMVNGNPVIGMAIGCTDIDGKYDITETTHTIICECGNEFVQDHRIQIGEITKQPTCTETGLRNDYCADCGYQDPYTLAAKDHAYGEATYTWSDDNATCTATRICANDATHVETETVNSTRAEKEAPTCTVMGWTTYSATFTVDWAEAQTKDVQDIAVIAHSWTDANCTTPKTCSVCSATEGEALGHSWTAANCTIPKTCSVCGATEGVALGHSWTAATCTTPKTCSVCGATEGVALGHKWTAATCTTPKTCSVCGATEGSALNHAWSDTYTSNGDGKDNTHYQTCTNCGATNTAVAHTWGEGVINPPSTCLGEGTKTFTCTAEGCGATYTETVNAKGHTFGDATTKVDAKCESTGMEAYKQCTVCNLYFAADAEPNAANGAENTNGFVINALDHDYAETFTVDKKASCTEAGSKSKHCSRCASTTEVTEIPVRTHNMGEWVTVNESTCTVPGSQKRTCQNGETDEYVACTHEETQALQLKAHAWGDWATTKAATCLAAGEERRDCTDCDAYETNVLTQLAHSYTGEYKWDNNSNPKTHSQKCVNGCDQYGNETKCTFDKVVTDPTCLGGGYTTYTCTVCNNSYDADHISALGHAYQYAKGNGTSHAVSCSRCTYTATENCAGGTAYCNAKAVCEKCKTAWGEVDANNHAELKQVAAKAATCLDSGWNAYEHCTECPYTTYVEAPALGHTFGTTTAYKAATCTETGNEAYKQCETCNLYFADAETETSTAGKDSADAFTIAIVADAHDWNDGVVTTEPTCEGAGVKTFTCKHNADHTYTEAISANGHKDENPVDGKCDVCGKDICEHGDVAHTDEVKATCISKGNIEYWTCNVCNKNFSDADCKTIATNVITPIDSENHKNTTDYDQENATCTTVGYTAGTYCNDCRTWISGHEEIPAKNHAWSVSYNWTQDADKNWVCTATRVCANDEAHNLTATASVASKVTTPATCVAEGTTTYTATFAEDWAATQTTSKVDVAIDADNHTNLVQVSAQPETCTEIGWEAYEKCDGCGYTTYKEISAKNHAWSVSYDWTQDADKNWVCTATRVCANDEAHNLTATASVASKVTTPATCVAEGTTTYTATFAEDWAATQTTSKVDVAIDADNHTNLVQVGAQPETCTEIGWEAYEKCDGCGYTTYKEISAKNHAWTVSYDWTQNADGEWLCTATRVCANDEAHVETATATVASEVTDDPTCTEAGTTTYTATFAETWATTQTKAEVDVVPINHDYDMTKSEANLTRPVETDGAWSKGYYTFICKNDASHTFTEEVDRANYTEYTSAWNNLEALLATDLTTEAKTAINEVLDANDIAKNLITSEQTTVDEATANLKACFDQYKGALNTYTVTFVVDDKTYTVTVISGSDAAAPETSLLVKASDADNHYTFSKWDKEFTNVTSDFTVTAEFASEAHYGGKATCTETGKCEYCGYEYIPATDHSWSVEYNFAADGKSCTATRVCGNDANHNITATATITSAVKTPETCEGKGTTTYTATFTETWATTQTKEVEDIAPKGHAYGDATYNFAADGSSCTATRVCANDASHVENATATITSAVKDPATCEGEGTTTYTASFAENWATTQTKDVVDLEPIGHKWSATTYNFAEDGKSCTATRVCANDANHVETANATITSAVKTPATCEGKGTTTYTATFTETWATTQTKEVEDIAPADHTWGDATYTWALGADGNWTCTADSICTKDEAHTRQAYAVVTGAEKTPATCVDMGTTTYTATFGVDWATTQTKDVVDIDVLGHDYTVYVDTIDYTCTTEGYDIYKCSRCEETEKQNIKPAAHRPEADYTVIVKASCDENGYKAILCSECDEELETETIAKREHNIVDVAETLAPTCTTPGTMSQKCDCAETDEYEACNYTTTRELPIEADAHYWGNWTIVKEANCVEKGSSERVCQHNSAHKETKKIAISTHNHKALEHVDAQAATCEEIGWDAYDKCDSCGYTTYVEIPATGHEYVGTVTKEETCTEDGVMTYTCKNDATHTYTEVIPAHHTDVNDDGYCDDCKDLICEHKNTKVVNAQAVTCLTEGYTGDVVCQKCLNTIEKGEAIPALGHNFGEEPYRIVPATCTSLRTTIYKCDNCTETRTVVDESGAYGPHTIIEIKEVLPTCDEMGFYVYYCTTCSTNVRVEQIPALGHADNNGDGICDADDCGCELNNGDGTKACSCICHKEGWFMEFIYKIVKFFWKLFGIGKTCECGAVHY